MVHTSRTIYAFAREMFPRNTKQDIAYGTAGFRTKATLLDYVMYRMGLLAVLRARHTRSTIGVMITASHNPEPDNGVKLVDPMGEMLDQSWESWATKLANVPDDQLEAVVQEINAAFNISNTQDRPVIFIGKDTRPSSPHLSEAVAHGVRAIGGKPIDFGIVTTPQLHFFVACKNSNGAYGIATEAGYYTKICTAFKKLRGDEFARGNYKNVIVYDGANGVGAKKVKFLREVLGESLQIDMYNDEIIGSGKLNHLCGADYVKSQQKFPTGVPDDRPNVRCCSVDGDADRLIYYYKDELGALRMLDGDRIATLFAGYIKEVLQATGVDLHLGLVQTAYANGASTRYISEELKVPVSCVSTGVKHLHHKALDYDIGVYFEANGHGTVVFSAHAKEALRKRASDKEATKENREAAQRLLNFVDVINETVGDAISDMLLVETILHAKGWDVQDWERAYADLPNKLVKVTVEDRRIFTTTDAERRLVTPNGLQDIIDELVAECKDGRSFVRASGTEDAVRVYAEAATKEEVDRLALEVSRKVYELGGGVGAAP